MDNLNSCQIKQSQLLINSKFLRISSFIDIFQQFLVEIRIIKYYNLTEQIMISQT